MGAYGKMKRLPFKTFVPSWTCILNLFLNILHHQKNTIFIVLYNTRQSSMPSKEKPKSFRGVVGVVGKSSNASSIHHHGHMTKLDGKSNELLKISPNVKRYSDIKKPSNHSNTFTSTIGSAGVVFNQVKARKCIEDYEPEDELEKWLLKHNEKNLVLCLEYPTHVSQRGGHYHIIFRTQSMYNEYLQAWKNSITINNPEHSNLPKMYIEELRTKHAFRLYVDIDIKLAIEEKYDIVEKGWIDDIMKFTWNYFFKNQRETNLTMILTQCHGKWEDSVTTTSKYKSGYRLYFHDIIVDFDKFCDYTHNLCYTLQGKFDHYNGQPHDWTFEDVIDLKTCNHPRCRLFGSAKWRRGDILPRIYEFYGAFRYNPTSNKAIMDNAITSALRENVCELLRLTSTRVEDPFDEDDDSHPTTATTP